MARFAGKTGLALVAALLAAVTLLSLQPAMAQPSPYGFGESALAGHGLPVVDTGTLRLYHSPSAGAGASQLAKTMSAAVDWYRGRLDWDREIAVAVLDRQDWEALSVVPYPVPYAQLLWDVVVMPDSIESFPGFDRWGFEPRALNEALTFHEIGHIAAHRLGIRSGNHFVEELIANIFLAAYVRAERPDLAFILAGVPAGFDAGMAHRRLVDLDDLYAGVGLMNYAWFQFRLAVLADYMVARAPLEDIVGGLRDAFPADTWHRRETIAASLARLEAIVPGVTSLAADLIGDGLLPRLLPGPCGQPAKMSGEPKTLFVENRTARDFKYRIPTLLRETIEIELRIDTMLSGIGEDEFESQVEATFAEVMTGDGSYETLAPGRIARHMLSPGTLVETRTGCATMPDHAARLVVE